MLFNVFKEEVAKEFGIPVQFQRFWLWAMRQNHTYRPNRPLTHLEEAQPVGQLREISNKANNGELKLFLEVELGRHFQPVSPPEKTEEDILLFFKLYDPSKKELRYIGRMFVKATGRPMEILTRINKMAGFDPDEEIELYEVGLVIMFSMLLVFKECFTAHLSLPCTGVKFEPVLTCQRIDKRLTFRTSELQDGDIICLQKFSEVVLGQCRCPDVPSFLEYVRNRWVWE
ncbi:hypothetical protein F3Y22_tig00111881pilonHSYRG00066 [Hibiscus syriacus]|uniref:Ubiquitin carboxyl-terminal hydrolase 7 ICP0-binding domain-containing protein n=1 Tax=Hibiscus syriacus TaxID=106335 RepID=A0A6A2YF39_HIBSY|nr:hypothetical protein F3Y22_tig00111881pilonHSYRG00066 [Hibiscus syriacus]